MRNPVRFIQLASTGSSLANSLRLSGYPESVARNPRRFWDNTSFMKSIEEYFRRRPSEMYEFVEALKRGLSAAKSSGYPDHARRLYFLRLAYKCKGHL